MKKLMILALLVSSFFSHAGTLYVAESTKTTQVLRVRGEIDDTLNSSFLRPKDFMPTFSYSKRTTLVFDNLGGYVNPGFNAPLFFMSLSFKIRDNSGFPLVVKIETMCVSMCIPIFNTITTLNPDDVEIQVAKDSLFGFHAAGIGDRVSTEATYAYKKMLTDFGVNTRWIEENSGLFDKRSVTYRTAQQLVDQDSGIVEREHLY